MWPAPRQTKRRRLATLLGIDRPHEDEVERDRTLTYFLQPVALLSGPQKLGRNRDHRLPWAQSDPAWIRRNRVQRSGGGPDNCLFGTERPGTGSAIDPKTGRSMDDVKGLVDEIEWLTDEDRYKIYEGNARKLFRLDF